MKVTVNRVRIPPMSTLGYGYGTNDEGERVAFAGDWRPMHHIGEALEIGEEVTVELEPHQILAVVPIAEVI